MRMIAPVTLAASLVIAGSAQAKPPLRDVKEIDDRMYAVGLAIEISDRCDAIEPRTLKGLAYLWDLKARASKLGYSDDEIEAYVRGEDEIERMRKRGNAYMRSLDLDPSNDQDLCTLGRAEIERGSQTGAFLRAK